MKRYSHKFISKVLGRYIPNVGDRFYRTLDMNRPGWKPHKYDTLFKCVGFDGLFVNGKDTKTGKITRFSVLYSFRARGDIKNG